MLTDVLGSYVNAFSLRFSTIYGHANNLLRIFILIEMALFGIYMAIEGGELIVSLFKKIMLIGAFQLLISKYAWITDTLKESFVAIGLATGSGPKLSSSEFLDPSALIDQGFNLVSPIWDNWSTSDLIFIPALSMLPTLFSIVASVAILIAFVGMAIQVFLTLLEWYIVTTLAIILIPFGLFKPTSFLTDKAIGAIFASSIKLMVLAFVVSVSRPVLESFKFETSFPDFRQTFSIFVAVWAVLLVMKKAPAIAVGMVSGSANLEAGPMLQPLKTIVTSVVTGAIVGAAGRALASMGAAAKAASSMGGGSNSGESNSASNVSSAASTSTSQAPSTTSIGSSKKG